MSAVLFFTFFFIQAPSCVWKYCDKYNRVLFFNLKLECRWKFMFRYYCTAAVCMLLYHTVQYVSASRSGAENYSGMVNFNTCTGKPLLTQTKPLWLLPRGRWHVPIKSLHKMFRARLRRVQRGDLTGACMTWICTSWACPTWASRTWVSMVPARLVSACLKHTFLQRWKLTFSS